MLSTQDLTQLSLFQGLSPNQITLLQPYLELCDYSKDTVVFEQGDAAHYLYIVLQGELLVSYHAYDGYRITVARARHGGICGWSAVLGRPTYTAGAVCFEDSLVYRISGKALQRLCEQYPDTGIIILERLANVIADHLRNTHTEILAILTKGVEGKSNSHEKGINYE